MKKRIVRIGIILIAIYLAMGGVALATYPHGEFADNTDACAACHRTHTAISAYLIAAPNSNSLCTTCHWGGTSADTDVKDGVYTASGEPDNVWGQDGGKLLAGGFMNIGGAASTSQHILNTPIEAFGSDTGATVTLDCMSCHSPHMDKANQNQYRLLRLRPNGASPAVSIPWNGPWTDSSQTVKATTTGGYRAYTEKDFDPTTPGIQYYTNNYKDNVDEWCIACHTRYRIRGDGLSKIGDTLTSGTTLPAGTTATSSIDVGLIGGDWTLVEPYTLLAEWTLTGNVTLAGSISRLNGDDYNAGDVYGEVPRFRHATDIKIQGETDPFNWLSYRLITDLPLEDFAGDDGTGSTPAEKYTHRYTEDKMTCLTCHRSHGTDVVMTGYADFANSLYAGDRKKPDGSPGLPTNSMLLRLPNRGVCVSCHSMGTF